MASGSLKFVVEVNADQATQGFRAISSGLDDLGIKSKVSFLRVAEGGRGAGDAASSLEQKVKALKGEMASGDRTINFFARSLNGIIPEASGAGRAIRLLADGFIGGVGLGFALQGVMAILETFGESLRETAEKERKAAEESKKAAEDRLKAWVDADRKWRELKFVRAGGTKEGFEAGEANTAAVTAVQKAQKEFDDAQMALARLKGSVIGAVPNPVDLEKARGRVEAARTALQQELEAASKIVAVGAAASDGASGGGVSSGSPVDTGSPVFAPVGGASAAGVDWNAVSAGMGHPALGTATYDLTGANEQFSKNFLKGEKNDDKERRERVQEAMQQMQEMKALADPIAQAFGQTFAAIGSGAQGMAEIWKTAAKQIMQVLYQMAVKSIMSHAAGAAAGAAESQAAIPLVGPAMAMAAMGAMMAAVTALLSNVPSAAGGWMVPRDTLAMVHEDERILPAKYSEGLDRLVNGGGSPSVVVNVSTMDVRGFEDALRRNDSALFRVLSDAARDRRY